MDSSTKNRQTVETIEEMIQKAFGEDIKISDANIKELTEGFFNVAYEVELPDHKVILKIAPPITTPILSYEKNIMKAEVEGLRYVEKATKVPVPKVLFYDDTRQICEADYFFMEKIEGESFFKLRSEGKLSIEEQDAIFQEIGRLNKEMNEIEGTRYGYIGQPEKQGISWKETFLVMISDLLTDGEAVAINLGISNEEVHELINKAGFSLGEVQKPVFVHWDLWDGNVFVKDGSVSGIIDFERALWGDPLLENYFRSHCITQSFIKGYNKNLRAEAPIRALLYDMYLYLIMVIETAYRNYPDDWQISFATKELQRTVEELRSALGSN